MVSDSRKVVAFGPRRPVVQLGRRPPAKTPAKIAAAFQAIDVHDDTIERCQFLPAKSHRTSAKVEITLFRHWEGTRRLLRLLNCANIEFIVDAGILLDNAPSNTCSLEATADVAAIEELIRRHERSWNLTYEVSEFEMVDGAPPSWWVHPLTAKLSAATKLVLFRIQLFGGVLEVLAPNFTIQGIRD